MRGLTMPLRAFASALEVKFQSVVEDTRTAEFVTWLRQRGCYDHRCPLVIGTSPYGRGLFAARPMQAGERMIEIPRDLMITSKTLPRKLYDLIPENASEWSRLALFLLAERNSNEWDPFIRILPALGELHSTVFWSDEELECVKHSSLYTKTLQRKELISKELLTVQKALAQFPRIFGRTASEHEFVHAYSTVTSRSWRIEGVCKLAMVPCIDLINHDCSSRSLLSYDPDKNCVLVISDRDYEPGQEVAISYGVVPNSSLLVDYGFVLPFNPFDEVQIWLELDRDDSFYNEKLQLLSSAGMQLMEDVHGDFGRYFTIKNQGLDSDLLSFAHIVYARSLADLASLKMQPSSFELAWSSTNARRHTVSRLSSLLQEIIQQYVTAELSGNLHLIQNPKREEMAQAVVDGERRILKLALQNLGMLEG